MSYAFKTASILCTVIPAPLGLPGGVVTAYGYMVGGRGARAAAWTYVEPIFALGPLKTGSFPRH